MRRPVYLVQPPAGGLRSGGYTYNEEIGSRLERRGRGRLLESTREQLAETLWPHPCTVLLDSLLVPPPPEPGEAEAFARAPVAWYLLLHLWPLEDPTARVAAKRLWREAVSRWLPLLRGVVVTGERAAAEWKKHLPGAFAPIVAPPAIAPVPRRETPPADPGAGCRLVTVGTISARKNQRFLLETLLATGERNFSWDLAGECDRNSGYVREFLERIRHAGLEDTVRVHGSVSGAECARLIGQADLFVSGSQCESYGMATAKALGRGVPTLSFDVGDVRRWISPQPGAWIFDPGDGVGFQRQLQSLVQQGPPFPRPPAARLPVTHWDDTLARLLTATS